jgi:hypothetical protein
VVKKPKPDLSLFGSKVVTAKVSFGQKLHTRHIRLVLEDGEYVLHTAFAEYFAFSEVFAILYGGRFVFPVVTILASGVHDSRIFVVIKIRT